LKKTLKEKNVIKLENNYKDHESSGINRLMSFTKTIRTLNRIEIKNKNCYLCGAMEYLTDYGADWRKIVEKKLQKHNIDSFNPAEKNKLNGELQLFDKCSRHELKYSEVKKWAYNIIQTDLSALIKSDVVLCYWIKGVATYGTPAELTVAKMFDIPVLLVCDIDDYTELPKWVLGCCDYLSKDLKTVVKDVKKVLSENKSELKRIYTANI